MGISEQSMSYINKYVKTEDQMTRTIIIVPATNKNYKQWTIFFFFFFISYSFYSSFFSIIIIYCYYYYLFFSHVSYNMIYLKNLSFAIPRRKTAPNFLRFIKKKIQVRRSKAVCKICGGEWKQSMIDVF